MGRDHVAVARDALRLHAGTCEPKVHEVSGPGAGLTVHEAEARTRQVREGRESLWIARGHNEAEIPVEKVHERRRPGFEIGAQPRTVVLPRVRIDEVHAGDVSAPRGHRLQPGHAADARHEEHRRPGLGRQDLGELVERRIVAPGEEQAVCRPARVRHHGVGLSPAARAGVEPLLQEVLRKEPFAGDPCRGDRAAPP